jgi:hypothetical protein
MLAVPRGDRDELFYQPPGSMHYNIQLAGGALCSRVTARYFEGMRPEQIEWIWMVEAKRPATAEESKAGDLA